MKVINCNAENQNAINDETSRRKKITAKTHGGDGSSKGRYPWRGLCATAEAKFATETPMFGNCEDDWMNEMAS